MDYVLHHMHALCTQEMLAFMLFGITVAFSMVRNVAPCVSLHGTRSSFSGLSWWICGHSKSLAIHSRV